MADISKCIISATCAQRDRCYRHTAPDSLFSQSYIMPEISEDGCQDFWANEGYRQASNEGTKLDNPRS